MRRTKLKKAAGANRPSRSWLWRGRLPDSAPRRPAAGRALQRALSQRIALDNARKLICLRSAIRRAMPSHDEGTFAGEVKA